MLGVATPPSAQPAVVAVPVSGAAAAAAVKDAVSAPVKKASYLPLIIALNAVALAAILLVVFFLLKR